MEPRVLWDGRFSNIASMRVVRLIPDYAALHPGCEPRHAYLIVPLHALQ